MRVLKRAVTIHFGGERDPLTARVGVRVRVRVRVKGLDYSQLN